MLFIDVVTNFHKKESQNGLKALLILITFSFVFAYSKTQKQIFQKLTVISLILLVVFFLSKFFFDPILESILKFKTSL